MARKYVYLGPSDTLSTREGESVPKGGEITLSDAEATDLAQRGHRLDMADARRKPPEKVEEAAKEAEKDQ